MNDLGIFALGLVIGANLGLVVFALCAAASASERGRRP